VKTVIIDGIRYIEEQPRGHRAVIVVDRGWIFAGDVTEANGRIRLDRAVWLLRWESIGFDGVIANPKSDKVKLCELAGPVDLPADAEIFRVPVADDWGLLCSR
jgi:hypothetical protein